MFFWPLSLEIATTIPRLPLWCLEKRATPPRLIAVRMPGVTHVVCFIEEAGAYLDYNCRGSVNRIIACDRTIEAIAASVAASYNAKWSSASEFTYGSGLKTLVATVLEPVKVEKRFASLFR